MDIKVTNCNTGHPINMAMVMDIYGGTYLTDSSGLLQIAPGQEDMYLNTVVQISGGNYITKQFTLLSLSENDFCLMPVGVTGGTGGLY